MKTLIESDGVTVVIKLTPENLFEEAIINAMNLSNISVTLQKIEETALTITTNPHVK